LSVRLEMFAANKHASLLGQGAKDASRNFLRLGPRNLTFHNFLVASERMRQKQETEKKVFVIAVRLGDTQR